jgi:hypothetical protein
MSSPLKKPIDPNSVGYQPFQIISNENHVRLHRHRVEMLEKAIAVIRSSMNGSNKEIIAIDKLLITFMLSDNSEKNYKAICEKINELIG